MSKFYVTTAIPYVNARPHIGHALEYVQGDVVARYHRLKGDETCFLYGADENSLKNVQAAEKEQITVQELVDRNSEYFQELVKALNISFDIFQKGSSQRHHSASQKLWKLCAKNGDIYKKKYTGLYCVGCEMFYEKDELNENGECFEHPGKKLEEVSEENYFFKLSGYQEQLLELLEKDTIHIIPTHRKNEVVSFLKQGLKDISISRSNERAKNWGVPIPEDATQRMYVWFDALNIYQSGVGFGSNDELYKKWWPADLHMIGKGIIRFHAVYWPAFLLSANLPLPKALFVHGYFTVNGQKMSKSLGNVIDPMDMIRIYGVDGLRYYLLKEISPTGDGDFSEEKLTEVYNADLANGLGNLVSRIAKLCEKAGYQHMEKQIIVQNIADHEAYIKAVEEYRFNEALFLIWGKIRTVDKYINEEKPWELVKQRKIGIQDVLSHCVKEVQEIAVLLKPFLPQTAESIETQFKTAKIISQAPLFPRISL